MNNPVPQNLEADLRILVVDDLPQARRIVRNLLQRLGVADVRDAAGLQEAVASLKSQPVDLVITDVILKDGTGIDLLRQIRGDSAIAELPVVVITSDPDREHVIEGGKLGLSGFLIKPFDASRLKEKILAALA
jgi:two-component system chemotaxis response regulator CheY